MVKPILYLEPVSPCSWMEPLWTILLSLKLWRDWRKAVLSRLVIFLLLISIVLTIDGTICPGSSDLFYIVSYYINWVTTSWTHRISYIINKLLKFWHRIYCVSKEYSYPFNITYYIKWVTSSWTHSILHIWFSSSSDYNTNMTIDFSTSNTSTRHGWFKLVMQCLRFHFDYLSTSLFCWTADRGNRYLSTSRGFPLPTAFF